MLVNVQKEVDADLASSGGVLDLIAKAQESGTRYPKMITEVLLSDTQAGGATHATINVRLNGGGERVVLRLQCGVKHELAISRIYSEHTDVNGLVVFGPR